MGVASSFIVPRPCTSGSFKLSIGAFIPGIFCFFQNFEKGWREEAKKFVFVIIAAKCRQKNHWIFQIFKDCDQEHMNISRLNVLYQISLSQDSTKYFVLIGMSFNHEKMSFWNASIWVRGPCRHKKSVLFTSYYLF